MYDGDCHFTLFVMVYLFYVVCTKRIDAKAVYITVIGCVGLVDSSSGMFAGSLGLVPVLYNF